MIFVLKQHARRGLVCALLLLICCVSFQTPVKGAQLGVSAQSALLMAADTGKTLYEKNADEKLPMASTTKIMTALLAVEAAQKEDSVVTITEEMVRVEGSSMGLRAGDKIRLSLLAAGMLLASGNDAANAAALFLAGTQEEFAEKMNQRAKEIGMLDTHFVTPSGLDDEGHFSTAYDMALLAREALKNKVFRQICSSKEYKVDFEVPEKTAYYSNHNKLLWQYEGCVGVKTGFTKKSGRCLVSAAERDGVLLIAVTLNAPDDWNDHKLMLDEGFAQLESVSLSGDDFAGVVAAVGGRKDSLSVCGTGATVVAVPKGTAQQMKRKIILPAFVYAPVKKGDRIGEIQYYLEDTEIYSTPVVAGENIQPCEKDSNIFEKIFG